MISAFNNGSDPPDVVVFVQLGQGLVLFDIYHQICQGAESVPEVHEAAFEVAANDMLGPDQRHLSGDSMQFEALAEDGFKHRQGRDLRTR